MADIPNIPQVEFNSGKYGQLGFEILPFEKLGQKIALEKVNHNPQKPHRPNFHIIFLVSSGEPFTHYIDFQEYLIAPGSLVFLAKDQVHAFGDSYRADASMILFTEGFLTRNRMMANEISIHQLHHYSLYSPIVKLSPEQLTSFTRLTEQLTEEFYTGNDFAKEEVLQSFLRVLLLKAERIRKQHHPLHSSSYFQGFTEFQGLLRKHGTHSRRVAFFAEQMNISPKKLNAITQEIAKQSAKSYINSNLVLEVKRMLVNSVLSIKEIAYQSGFDEPTNFIKFFRKHVQMTPTTFRKQY